MSGCEVLFVLWLLDPKKADLWPPFGVNVIGPDRTTPLVVYHPHWVLYKPNSIFSKS